MSCDVRQMDKQEGNEEAFRPANSITKYVDTVPKTTRKSVRLYEADLLICNGFKDFIGENGRYESRL